MENTIIKNIEVEEQKPEIDQEKFNEAMDKFLRLAWECSQLDTDEEKQAYAIGRDIPAIINFIIGSSEVQFYCEEDKDLDKIIMEELLIMIARTLNRVAEKDRNEFKEIFID